MPPASSPLLRVRAWRALVVTVAPGSRPGLASGQDQRKFGVQQLPDFVGDGDAALPDEGEGAKVPVIQCTQESFEERLGVVVDGLSR